MSPVVEETDEEYTSIWVQKTDPSPFKVFWLVPNQGYFVRVTLGNQTYEEFVKPSNLGPGAVYNLKQGGVIF